MIHSVQEIARHGFSVFSSLLMQKLVSPLMTSPVHPTKHSPSFQTPLSLLFSFLLEPNSNSVLGVQQLCPNMPAYKILC